MFLFIKSNGENDQCNTSLKVYSQNNKKLHYKKLTIHTVPSTVCNVVLLRKVLISRYGYDKMQKQLLDV